MSEREHGPHCPVPGEMRKPSVLRIEIMCLYGGISRLQGRSLTLTTEKVDQ